MADAKSTEDKNEAAAGSNATLKVEKKEAKIARSLPQVQDAFHYTKTIYVTISNENYDETRKDPNMKNMLNLTSVDKDCEYVWEQFKKHEGFEEATKHKLKDASFKEIGALLKQINDMVYANQSNESTLVFFYYGGHGMIKDGLL